MFQRRTLPFVASGPTAAPTFASQPSGSVDSAYAHVDNVSVASAPPVVPTPAALPAGAACLGALAFRRLLRSRR